MYTFMHALTLLDSPLHDLTFYQYGQFTLTSSTFKSYHKWSKSLQKLEITANYFIYIYGSPFKWFSKLLVLRLDCQPFSNCMILTLPNIAFNGLSTLKELYLNSLHIHYTSITLEFLIIFASFNSLTILELSQNAITDDDKLTQVCNIKSLENLDVI